MDFGNGLFQQVQATVTDAGVLSSHKIVPVVVAPAAGRDNDEMELEQFTAAAFNIVNGEVFRWNWMWPKLAAHLGVAAAEYPGHAQPLEKQMAGMEPVWDKIVAKHGLQKNALTSVASWWHSDADLGRIIENFTDMTKSRD
mgnify:CR=1 FL=1